MSAAISLFVGCAVGPVANGSAGPVAPTGAASNGTTLPERQASETSAAGSADASSRGGVGADEAAAFTAPHPPGTDLSTRHALFRVTAFDTLPGWHQDDLGEAWAAFRLSCKALERKAEWQRLCPQIRTIQAPQAARRFLEREFTLLAVQNTDRSRDGDITGYYEPLLQGRTQPDARYAVPVYGVPRDLYFLDWKTLPVAQRKGVAYVAPRDHLLLPSKAGVPAAVAVDLRRFTLDTLDRRLRVRLQAGEGLPYYSRAEIAGMDRLDAPVLAWVDDPIALYAMQVQGAGRIRLPDGRILRLQYADQNGQPFKPIQLAAQQGNERVQTRGRATADADARLDDDEIEHFELADAVSLAPTGPVSPDADTGPSLSAASRQDADGGASGGEIPLTRGARPPALVRFAPDVDTAQVEAAVQSLTPQRNPTPRPTVATPRSSPDGQRVLDQLLAQPRPATGVKAGGGAAPAPAFGIAPAAAGRPPSAPGSPAWAASPRVAALEPRTRALDADPSYVFFRAAPDQSQQGGPVGALGVPLTAGRSLAVDPRVVPLGYPVFLDAAPTGQQKPEWQRLMFAQDTGGAIRGAVRADYFWGYGADAGRHARSTRQRGRMWVLVPNGQVESLLTSKLVTRGGSSGAPDAAASPECLVADGPFCDDIEAPEPKTQKTP